MEGNINVHKSGQSTTFTGIFFSLHKALIRLFTSRLSVAAITTKTPSMSVSLN